MSKMVECLVLYMGLEFHYSVIRHLVEDDLCAKFLY